LDSTIFIGVSSVIRIVTAFTFLLFTAFLATRKKGHPHAFRMLAGFLLASALLLIDNIAISYHVERLSPHLWCISYPFVLFFSPMLYLFTQAVLRNQTRMQPRDWPHLIPFFLLYAVMFLKFYRLGGAAKLEIIRHGFHLMPIIRITWAACEIQFIVYALLSLNLLRRYRRGLKEFYSSLEEVNLSWLNLILYGFIGWRVLYMISGFLNLPYDSWIMIGLQLLVEVGFLFFAVALVYKALTAPVVFLPETVASKKYRTSPLNETDKKQYLQKMEAFMNSARPYRDPNLTLSELSKRSSIPMRYASQVLNELLNRNYYDYVNGYRIEEVKRVLSDPAESRKNITEVFLEAGFNSKSVFNATFKKQVGMTPREFRTHRG
jgi:AraC-like DNA-binding protein